MRIHVDGAVVEVGPPQRSVVFAALVADAGRPVSREALIDRVWGQSPPRGAWRTVQTHVASIRGLLTRAGTPGQAVVVRRHGGYLLDIDPDLVDVHQFRRLAAQATHDELGTAERIALWREAVGLWRGEPLVGLGGLWVERTREAWYGEYREAVMGWAYTEIRSGNPTAAIGPLTELIDRYPLVEALPEMLMRALYRVGRRIEALDCYAAARQRLEEELAEPPGADLQAVYQAILRREADVPPPLGVVPAGAVVPAQLPADVRGFTGRGDHLHQLDAIAATAGGDAAVGEKTTAVAISAITGTAGVGKTALAVHWAHRAAHRFPDGQLYVNLRGFDPGGTIMEPADAIRKFLDALAVPPERIPSDRDAQAALYRTQLVDKRMLIVLDNARDTAQVRPLLPGAPGCFVLVTSRNQLTSLVAATGAHPLALDLLTADEARGLLIRRLGTRRVAAEPEAVNTLITRCARLPLALAIAAGRAATHPQLPLAALAAELVDTHLDALADSDPATDIRTVFSWSYHALDAEAARVSGLLGLAPGPDISLPAAASLIARSITHTQVLLHRLDEAHLVQHHQPGRYRMHDLVKLYAAERAIRDLPSQEREAGLRRLVDHYTHTAFAGARLLYPHRPTIVLDPPAPGSHSHPLPDRTAALAWFEAEHPHLLAAQQTVVEQGWHTRVWQLAWTLNIFHQLRGRQQDDMTVWRAGLAAAEHLADATIQSLTHRHLGHACAQLGCHDEAVRHLHHALALAEYTNNLPDQALTHRALAWAWELRGDDRQARGYAHRALRLYQALDQPVWEASALNMMGWLSARLGEHDKARTHCLAALDLCRRHQYLNGEAATLDSLGYIAHHTGRHVDAVDYYQQALTLSRDLGDTYDEADTLDHLGHAHAALGQHRQARDAWQQARALYRAQHRLEDAQRAHHQLDTLDQSPDDN